MNIPKAHKRMSIDNRRRSSTSAPNNLSPFIQLKFNSNNTCSDCIETLRTNPSHRTKKDIITIASYLNSLTSFVQILKSETETSVEALLLKVSFCMTYSSKPMNRFIVRYGEKGNCFYVILSGKVGILLAKTDKQTMTIEDYIKHLITLRLNNEMELLRSAISANVAVFHMNENFDDWLELNANNSEYSNELLMLIRKATRCIKKSQWNLDSESEVSVEDYIKANYPQCDESEEKKNKEDEKVFMIPSYQYINQFEAGRTFGYMALESKNAKRTATLITLTDCEFGIINKDDYCSLLRSVNEKARRNFYQVIYSYKPFGNISRATFEMYFFNFFKYVKIARNEKIIEDNMPCEYYYFVKSGQFELSTKKNIYEINELIIAMKKYINDPTYKHEEDQNEEYVMTKEFMSPEARNALFERRFIKLNIATDREIIGLDDLVLDRIGRLTLQCISNESEVYAVKRDCFKHIAKREPEVIDLINDFAKIKMKFIIGRLYHHKEMNRNERDKLEHRKIVEQDSHKQGNNNCNSNCNSNTKNTPRSNKVILLSEKNNVKSHHMKSMSMNTSKIQSPLDVIMQMQQKKELQTILPEITNNASHNETRESSRQLMRRKMCSPFNMNSHSPQNSQSRHLLTNDLLVNKLKGRRKPLMMDQFHQNLIHKTLYDNMLFSYIQKPKDDTILNDDNHPKSNNNEEYSNEEDIDNKTTIHSPIGSTPKLTFRFRNNQSRDIPHKTKVNVVDCLVFDKFNKMYMKAFKDTYGKPQPSKRSIIPKKIIKRTDILKEMQ